MMNVAANLAMQRAVERLLAEPAPASADRTELTLDPFASAWGAVWVETVEALAALRRAGRADYCIAAASWHLLFEQSNRCDPARDRITRRLRVTMWPQHAPPGLARLDQTGMIPMPP